MLERVPEGSTVLDVGCWSGFNGRFLAAERGVVVDGVEPDPEMAAHAAADYRSVIASTIESAWSMLRADGGTYDALLFLDVLEHLVDPADALRQAHAFVAQDGRLLISLPNVAHWSVRKELVLGRWTYRDYGLLDRTHLRFFTQATGAALIEDAGWTISWTAESLGQPPLVRLPEPRLMMLGRWPALFAVQFLFEARPR